MAEIITDTKQLTKSECKKLGKKMLGYGKRTAAIRETGIDGTTLDKAKKHGERLSAETIDKVREFIGTKQTA